MTSNIAIAQLTGEHLTETEYRAEQIMRLERQAREQDMAIRRAQLDCEAQERQARLLAWAIFLKMQSEVIRGMCEARPHQSKGKTNPQVRAGRLTQWLAKGRRLVKQWVSGESGQ